MMVPVDIGSGPNPFAAARWSRELASLRRSLEDNPDGPSAWLIKIRIDIFEYLTRRYAESNSDIGGSAPQPTAAASPPIQTAAPHPYRSGTADASDFAKPLKPRHQTRSQLSRISQANTRRYDRYERQRADLLYDYFQTTAQLDGLIEAIRKRHRRDHPHHPLNEFDLGQIVLDELKKQFR